MNLADFIIIYLACGTPFGMHHFFESRKAGKHWSKSLFVLIVWIPYALQLFQKNFSSRRSIRNLSGDKTLRTKAETRIEEIKNDLKKTISRNAKSFPVFEYTEIIERYIGLTVALNENSGTDYQKESEFYKITDNSNKNLSSRCLYRRNLKRLGSHQKLARRDFLNFLTNYQDAILASKKAQILLLELVKILDDSEGRKIIIQELLADSQINYVKNVEDLSKDLWKQEKFILSQITPTQITAAQTPLKAIPQIQKFPAKD